MDISLSRSYYASMVSYMYTSCQLLLHSCASRIGATTWRMLVDVGIAARLPTKRVCRGGARKQRTIDSVIRHRPPKDRPHTRCNNNNLIQVPTVSRVSAVIVDKSKFGFINPCSYVTMSTSVHLTLLLWLRPG